MTSSGGPEGAAGIGSVAQRVCDCGMVATPIQRARSGGRWCRSIVAYGVSASRAPFAIRRDSDGDDR